MDGAVIAVCFGLLFAFSLWMQEKEKRRWEVERQKLLDRIQEQNVSILHGEWRKDGKEPEKEPVSEAIPRGVSLPV